MNVMVQPDGVTHTEVMAASLHCRVWDELGGGRSSSLNYICIGNSKSLDGERIRKRPY